MTSLGKLADFFRRRNGNSPESELLIEETARSWADEARSVDPGRDRDWAVIRSRLMIGAEGAGRRPARNMHRFLKPAFALALVVAVVVAGSLWLQRGADMVYRTERGERATATLPDSSIVSLNHTSALTLVSITNEGNRRVTLSGEAYFRVRKEPRLFEVSTSSGRVRVLGTEFNVIARDDRMEVAVIRGSVAVSSLTGGTDSTVTLTDGEISFWRKGEPPARPALIPLPGYPGWIDGKLLFYRTTLADACREIEQTYNVTVRINDPGLRAQTLTGAVEGNTIEHALSALARLTGNTIRHEDGAYVLY